MNPLFHTDFSISDSLIFVRKSVLIYETIIADEVYKQLLLYNSEYKETIYKDENGDTDDLRLVDWKRKVQDSPHIFTSDDYDMIVNSKKLFARKFDEKTDINIVIQLHDRICEEQKVKGHL